MPDPRRWPDAVLAGLACSMRSAAGPGVLAARGKIRGKPRALLLCASAAELVVDKTPQANDRVELPAVLARVASGAYTGRVIAGVVGGLGGAVSAGVGSYSTWRIRKLVVERTGLPDPLVAIGEDLLAYGTLAYVTREGRDRKPPRAPGSHAAPAGRGQARPEPAAAAAAAAAAADAVAREAHIREHANDTVDQGKPKLRKAVTFGLIAGVAGTATMTIAQGAEFVLTGAEPSGAPADAASNILTKLGFGKIDNRHQPAANQAMHWTLGTSWGVPYGLIAARSAWPPEITGPLLGVAAWVAALFHQPLTGVAAWPWRRSKGSLSSEALFHLIYGIGAGGALRKLRRSARHD